MPSPQTFSNHKRIHALFHLVFFPVLLLSLVGASINLYESLGNGDRQYSASLIFVFGVLIFLVAFFTRTYALKVQDRAIRAEENLRHFALTGKLLPANLRIAQIVALRFASDAELPQLAEKATKEGLSSGAIKQAITQWRADTYRV